jgi:hypothetical protein
METEDSLPQSQVPTNHLSLTWASFSYVPEMHLQLSQISSSSSTSVCVAK